MDRPATDDNLWIGGWHQESARVLPNRTFSRVSVGTWLCATATPSCSTRAMETLLKENAPRSGGKDSVRPGWGPIKAPRMDVQGPCRPFQGPIEQRRLVLQFCTAP